MSSRPVFPSSPLSGKASISAAVTGRTTTGTTGLTQLIAPQAGGAIIDSIAVKASGTTTAGMVRLWRYNGAGDALLFREYPIAANTPSASNPGFELATLYGQGVEPQLTLDPTESLWVSTHNAEAFNVFALGGAY